METSSEEIRRVHAEIKGFLPPACFVIVEHKFRNNTDDDYESWGCQVYADNEQPLDSMFMIHAVGSAATLAAIAKERYESYKANKPDTSAKIAELEMKIAKLRGEQI